MKRKLLVVKAIDFNYLSSNDVAFAASFEEAKAMIVQEERTGVPSDDLDLNVQNKREFYEFVKWMERTSRRYSFSIFGYKNTAQFVHIRDDMRKRGFHFNS